MSEIEAKLAAEQAKIRAQRERIAATEYMKMPEVCRHLGLSRDVVRTIPAAVLPYADYGTGAQQNRRYHPADVAAYPGRLHRWKRASADGRGDECLAEMQAEIDEREDALIAAALSRYAA